MRKLLELFIHNPIGVTLFVVMAALGGTFALLHLPVGLFPGLDVPVVNIITHDPGTTAEDMELLISRPIEDRVRTIPGVRRVSSTSIEGISRIAVEFEWGTRLSDSRQLVQARLSAVRSNLPTGVTPRLENIGTTLQEAVGYVVYGAGSLIDLRTTVRMDIASRLMEVPGVFRVEVLGGDEPAYVVQIHPQEMARAHLTLGDVTEALASHNLVAAADFIDRSSREYLIRVDSRLKTIADIQAVPVRSDGVRSVFLRDIATIRDGRAPRHYRVHGNGKPAVAFIVSKQPGANILDVVHGVDQKLEELQPLLPTGATIHKFYDQADIVTEARDALFSDLILGALFATIVLYFFLGSIRATLIVAATIPIALLVTLAMMRAWGQTLNVITLSALTLAVGVVVDDAIVVAENIVRHLQTGGERRLASLDGAAEIAGPDASGTFTTVAAFAPLLLLGGIAGLFVRPFGLVISVSLLASLVVSLTFVPMMFGWLGLGPDPASEHRTHRPAMGARLLSRLDGLLQKILRLAFAHRAVVVVMGGCLLGLGGLAAWLGPIRVLPRIDEGALLIEYTMPPGTSLLESNRIGEVLENQALAEQDVDTVYRRTGSPKRGYQIEGVNRGEMTIKLTPRSVRTHTLDQIMDRLRDKYEKNPGVVFLYHQPTQEKMDESLSGLPAMFGVTIFGTDTDELVSIAGQVEDIMSKDTAFRSIVNNTKIKSPQIIVRPDPAELARLGLTPRDVSRTVRASRFGVLATTIIRQRQQVQVLVKMDSPADPTPDALKQLPVVTHAGRAVPLSRVADIRIDHLPPAVTRLNGQREVTLLAEVDGRIVSAVNQLRGELASIHLPEGYSIAFTGQYQVMRRTIRDLALVGFGAIVLIYLIMAMQFRSWSQPLIILLTIPAALVGAIVLLAVTGIGLDISVGMGTLTLLGIAVNNAIVLLDYANRRVAVGQSMPDALRSAASVRLRPILMTATTTIVSLIPIAVNPAIGSRIFQPFAVTVIGGLLSATAATLIFVPVLTLAGKRIET